MIVNLIIKNDVSRIEELLSNGSVGIYDLEPEFFVGKEGNKIQRKNRKTLLEVAQSLQRQDILDVMGRYRNVEHKGE